jgi:hypothetical protein
MKKDDANQSACCQICFKSMQCEASSTSVLHRYLKHIHDTKRKKNSENNPDHPMLTASKKQCSILQYIKGQVSEKTVSKLAVVDGLSITTISKK